MRLSSAAREAKEQAAREAKEQAERHAGKQAARWASAAAAALDGYVELTAGTLMVQRSIPKTALRTAVKKCQVPKHEIVIAVARAKPPYPFAEVFSELAPCANGQELAVAFGLHGIYFNDACMLDFSGGELEPFSMTYSSLADVEIDLMNIGEQQVVLILLLGACWPEMVQRLGALAEEHRGHLEDIKVHVDLTADELSTVKEDVIKSVVADRVVRDEATNRWSLALTEYLSDSPNLLVVPNIPEKKLRNAWEHYEIPMIETPIGLIDTTIFGSAKDGLLFGLQGIYFHNSIGKTPGTYAVPYSSLTSEDFDVEKTDVKIGDAYFYDVSAAQTAKVLEGVRELHLAEIAERKAEVE